MTRVRTSRRDRRMLGFGAVVIGAMLTFGKAVPAVARWESARMAESLESGQRLALTEAVVRDMRQASDSAAVRRRRLDKMQSFLVRGATPDAAAAALAELAERVAEAEGLDVQTLALKPDTIVRHEMVRVRVRINAQGDVDGLMNFLFALETHEARLTVHELSVTQPDAAAPTSRPDALRLEIGIQALALVIPPATKSARKT